MVTRRSPCVLVSLPRKDAARLAKVLAQAVERADMYDPGPRAGTGLVGPGALQAGGRPRKYAVIREQDDQERRCRSST